MRASFRFHTGVRCTITKLSLIGAMVFVCGICSAGEPSPNSSTVSVGANRAPAQHDIVKAVGHRIWSILEATERYHIAAPARSELWKIVAPVLCSPSEASSLNTIVDEFGRCQCGDDFSALFRKRWEALALHHPAIPLDQLPGEIIEALEKSQRFGPLRLMKVKDYAVEEQFRGNRYVGLGVSLRIDSDTRLPTFMTVMEGGAAARGGLKNGVTVLEIDGRTTRDVPTETLLDLLRGPVGSEVTLKVVQQGSTSEEMVTLTRGFVRFDSVFTTNKHPVNSGRLRFNPSEPIGFLAVQGITGSTLQELRQAEVRLRADGIRALVLDFRTSQRSDNFHQARLVADGLLDGGALWHWHERNAEPRAESADRECLFRGMPLVVVVDHSTGAAQAAVAAALQDAGRAVIVGQSPAFDGAIASGVPLSDEQHVLWMNTAKLTRSRTDRAWPLIPDHQIGQVSLPAGSLTGVVVDALQRIVVTQPKAEPLQAVKRQGQITEIKPHFSNGDGLTSALTPSNLTQNEILLRAREADPKAIARQQQMVNEMEQRSASMQAAQQLARELLMRLPPSS